MSAAEDRALFATLAALLASGRLLDGLSRCITIAVVLALLLGQGGAVALAASLVLGMGQTYVALRVAFDARLFHALAEGSALPDLAAMDSALLTLGLVPAAKAGRPALPRAAGARRLLRLQALLTVAQVLAAVLSPALG